MTSKIVLVLYTVLWFVTSGNSLFQGISFQRGFEINFKPLEKKPFEFLKESWSPFGVFGKKFAIQKRSIDDIVPVMPNRVPKPAAPVFEHIDEVPHIGTGPLLIVPRPPVASPSKPPMLSEIPAHIPLPAPMPIIVNDYPPLPLKPHALPPIATNMVIIQPTNVLSSHVLSTRGLYTDITRVDSVKEHITSEHHKKHHEESAKGVPVTVDASSLPISTEVESQVPAELVSALEIPPPPVEPIPPAPVAEPEVPVTAVVVPVHPVPAEPVPAPPVLAPIEPAPVPPVAAPIEPILLPPAESIPPPSVPPKTPEPEKPVLVEVEKEVISPPVPPETPKKEIVFKENSFIKGSKMALQFGTVFLTLMAQFLDSARASIDIMTNPPPKFN